jgi:thiol:disulfide interchange protein DsbD
MKLKNLVLIWFVVLTTLPWVAYAQSDDVFKDLFSNEQEFLPVEQAFQFDFDQQDDQLVIRFTIADDYYLYQNQFKTVVKNAEIGAPAYPPAKIKEDEFFEEPQPVFYHQVEFSYPILWSKQDGVVKLQFQGCADAGLCYPPTTHVIYLDEVGGATANDLSSASSTTTSTGSQPVSEQFELLAVLSGDDALTWKLLIFIAGGVLLAFTPCVFPMYPILSSIIVGQGKSITTSRAFVLSFVYVQGMAITYSILGLVVAFAGTQFTAMLQNPWVLSVFILLFVLLALAMFGAYELQFPSSWHEKLSALSNKQKGGSYIGVFLMGVISGLVASPCTTAPLTSILLYIAQEGDLVLGFSALYALSIGMGIPLILFAVSGGKLLPKAGNWMNIIKVTFGFMMLTVAVFFIERIITQPWTEFLWVAVGVCLFTYYFVMNQNTATTMWKGIRSLLIFVGLFGSAIYGYHQYITHYSSQTVTAGKGQLTEHPKFLVVKNLADFDVKLKAANDQGKTVMVDLYADWCVACKEFEKYTFPDPAVMQALSNTVLMQIDLTDNTPTSIEFQEAFDVLGLPTIMFFDTNGQEMSSARVTGFMKAEPFAAHIEQLFQVSGVK